MRRPSSILPTSTGRDIERTYFEDLASTPRSDATLEGQLARNVVRTRRAMWAVLLGTGHSQAVVAAIESQAKDDDVVALATELRERGGAETALIALAELLDRVGDEHAAAKAIVQLAAGHDAQWHREAKRTHAAFLAARSRFVAANLRLVVLFAKRYGHNRMPLGDRIQEGNLGLMKAVDRFDPERGVRFSTYAAWWIRHAIVRALSNGAHAVRIPPQVQQLFAKAERARARLRGELGRDPELRELAMAIDCDPERLTVALRTMALRSVSLDGDTDPDSGLSRLESLCDARSLAELEDVVDRHDRNLAVEGLARLPARERDIVHERFALPGSTAETFEEIGRRHGISRERARQVQRVALDRLRRTLEPRPALRPYNAA